MAINYNINPYSAGAVVIDQRPMMQMFQQEMLRKQARMDAMDNYFRDLSKNITPAGMRSQDVPGLTKKTNDWQQFYQQNKSSILNPRLDNGKAYSEYMSRYQDMLGHIQQSKDALKTTDELNKVRLNPQSSFILDDPTIIDQIHKHDLPLGDPNRKELNLATIAVPPKPWDVKDLEAHSKYLTNGLTQNKIPGATQFLPGFKTRTPIMSQFSDENLKAIGERSAMAYDMDRSLQFETNKAMKQLQNDPARQQQLNSEFHRLYGRNITTPKELRQAIDILGENKKAIEYKEGEDTYGRELALERVRFGHQKELKQTENDWIPKYFNERIELARQGQPTPMPDPSNALGIKMAHEIPVDALTAKAFEKNGKMPDRLYVTTDNKIWPVYFERYDDVDEKGKKTGSKSIYLDENKNPIFDKELSKPMDIDQAYLSLGYKGETKKNLGVTMKNALNSNIQQPSTKTYKLDGKSYTHDQLRKLGYTEDKIKTYIDAGILK